MNDAEYIRCRIKQAVEDKIDSTRVDVITGMNRAHQLAVAAMQEAIAGMEDPALVETPHEVVIEKRETYRITIIPKEAIAAM